jgi:hypothetical protein
LQHLVAAQISRDQDRGQSRSVRELVGTFRGLSGTSKQRRVLDETGLSRQPLAAFFADGKVDQARIANLFDAMRRNSRPVRAGRPRNRRQGPFRSARAMDALRRACVTAGSWG